MEKGRGLQHTLYRLCPAPDQEGKGDKTSAPGPPAKCDPRRGCAHLDEQTLFLILRDTEWTSGGPGQQHFMEDPGMGCVSIPEYAQNNANILLQIFYYAQNNANSLLCPTLGRTHLALSYRGR